MGIMGRPSTYQEHKSEVAASGWIHKACERISCYFISFLIYVQLYFNFDLFLLIYLLTHTISCKTFSFFFPLFNYLCTGEVDVVDGLQTLADMSLRLPEALVDTGKL